jgi:sodium-dependent phosphate cotransporter
MNLNTSVSATHTGHGHSGRRSLLQWIALAFLVYAFLVSIGMLSKAFKLYGGPLVDSLIGSASNPLVGMFVGILATTLVQSSSTTTSLVVALVGSGTMPVSTAIPVVMGANIGTSVTNTLVSLGHIGRSREFHRAFAASTVHDFFNIFAVVVLLPLQMLTDFLGIFSRSLAALFYQMGGLTFTSPLKMVTGPAVNGAIELLGGHPWLLLVVALVVMFGSLHLLVRTLKGLVLEKAQTLFDLVIFRNPGRAMLFGLALTVLVQSSSITTSLVVPLAGAGILGLHQIFPYTLGANVGTTITAMLAALAVGEISAVTVAFAHLLFNVCGIAFVWPLKAIRRVPVNLSRRLAYVASRNRWIPAVYIALGFYLIPLVLIFLLR